MLLWISVYKYFSWAYIFNDLRCISKSEIARWYNNPMFNFLRNCHTISKVATQFYMPASYMFFPYLHTCYHLFVFIITILMCVKRYITMFIMCISIMTEDVEHFFLLIIGICLSFLKINLSKICPFLIELFVFLLLNIIIFIYFRYYTLSNIKFAIVFSYPMCYLFTFLVAPFELQIILFFMKCNVSIFLFCWLFFLCHT